MLLSLLVSISTVFLLLASETSPLEAPLAECTDLLEKSGQDLCNITEVHMECDTFCTDNLQCGGSRGIICGNGLKKICCCYSTSCLGGPIGGKDTEMKMREEEISIEQRQANVRKVTEKDLNLQYLDVSKEEEEEDNSDEGTSTEEENSDDSSEKSSLSSEEKSDEESDEGKEKMEDNDEEGNEKDIHPKSKSFRRLKTLPNIGKKNGTLKRGHIHVEKRKKIGFRNLNLASANQTLSITNDTECRRNILKQYPKSHCFQTTDKPSCREACEKRGTNECNSKRGEIHKLNCKNEVSLNGLITCCCSVLCEEDKLPLNGSKATTPHQQMNIGTTPMLNNVSQQNEKPTQVGTDVQITPAPRKKPEAETISPSTKICTSQVDKAHIKQKLRDLCNTEDKVFVARKHCLEMRNGSYFCVKDGQCLGNNCTGCISHECQINGQRESGEPPTDYMEKHLRLKDFDKNVPINVDDREQTREWCTTIKREEKCEFICQDLVNRICGQEGKRNFDHDDFCRQGEPNCNCCCQPVCKG